MSRTIRAWAAALIVALAAVTVAGCAGDGGTTEETAVYPVTVTHELGRTVLDKAPKRIVALSDADLDALLLLGVQPVGVAASVLGDGVTPWARSKLAPGTTVLPVGEDGVDPGAVARLEPDLVLAGGDYHVGDLYERLAAVAPTTAYETGVVADPWQATVRQVAALLGRVDDGERLIAGVEERIAGVRTRYPGLTGTTFSLVQMFEPGSIGVVRSPEDPGVLAMTRFGMEPAPGVKKLRGDDVAVTLGLKWLQVVDADVVLLYAGDDGLRTALESDPRFRRLGAVRKGGYVPLDLVDFMALRTASPLAVEYVIDTVLPKIAAAATR